MYKFDENLYLEELPINTYTDLVSELNRDSNWTSLAETVAMELGYESQIWIQSLKCDKDGHSTLSPAGKLLFELNIKMCTVAILGKLLEECKLYSSLAVLRLPEKLKIIRQPNSQLLTNALEISLGQTTTLCCEASGLPVPSYLWYHKGRELKACTSNQLKITITSLSQEGEYRCKVSQIDRDGTVIAEEISESVFIKIAPTSVTIDLQPTPFLEVQEGKSFTISCEAQGHPAPSYQWFRDNTRLENKTSNELKIDNFSLKDEGKYYCCAFNEVSEVYTERSNVMLDLPREKAVAKVALLIANANYENHEKLSTPKNDVAKLAELLKEIGFTVICFMNLTLEQMECAINIFSTLLSDGVYGLFYFAGHGFKMQESYMLAVDAPAVYLRKDAISESQFLSTFLKGDPALLVIILDMCQTAPSKEFNPGIHTEIPVLNEYRNKKNLRNLVQAYSTSSYRPSYERSNNNYGLYVTHLRKFINRDTPVTRVFQEVGKSIDTYLKGRERNQIPMFAVTVTKPFRLTDAILQRKLPDAIKELDELISFSTKEIPLYFKQSGLQCKLAVSLFMDTYLNLVRIALQGIQGYEVNFFNSVRTDKNNLSQRPEKMECWLHNPQESMGPLVISVSKNGTPIGATLFHAMEHVPRILQKLCK